MLCDFRSCIWQSHNWQVAELQAKVDMAISAREREELALKASAYMPNII